VSKFTDGHVRKSEGLRETAYRYVDQYDGTFQFLVTAREAYKANGCLTVQTVRGVLNCMLADASVLNMPQPERLTFDARSPARPRRGVDFGPAGVDVVASPGHHLDPFDPEFEYPNEDEDDEDEAREIQPNPNRQVDLRVRWKVAFGVSNHVQASVIHRLDRAKSTCTWYPSQSWDKKDIIWRIKWICMPGYRANANPFGKLFLLTEEQLEETLHTDSLALRPSQCEGLQVKTPPLKVWRLCRTCDRLGDQGL